MFPIGDDNSGRHRFPYVTYLFIAANVAVFLLELQRGEAFIREWAFIPVEFIANPAAEFQTIFSSMFMHGGWLHLIGNMVYLWTFGDNIEDRFGHLGFIVFYIVCGIAAIFAQMAFMPNSNIPNVGASGAIAGVLGAYLLMFPRGMVRFLTNFGIIAMPAIVAIGLWFALQFLGILNTASDVADKGGVAYMAHIGGFVAGFVLALLFRPKRQIA